MTSASTAARTLVLLRHGRTEWNHVGRIQGQQDVGLDETGHAQAAAVAPSVAALSPSVLWCSDLRRTRETVAPVAAACGLEVTYDARLREFGFGVYEGVTRDELRARDPESFAAIQSGHYEQVRHAEPTEQVRSRMVEVLDDLRSALAPGETGVAVSHGAAIRLAVGSVLDWPADQFRSLRGLDNCGWVVLREHVEDVSWQLVAYNRVAG